MSQHRLFYFMELKGAEGGVRAFSVAVVVLLPG